MNQIVEGPLTLQPAQTQVRSSAPVSQQLVSEAHRAPAPGSISLRAGLEVDDGPVRTVRPETEHLLLGPPAAAAAARRQQLELPGAFNEHTGSSERRGRLDADRGAPGGGQVGLQDHPESLARVDPPDRALSAAQPHLEDDPGVDSSCKTAGSQAESTEETTSTAVTNNRCYDSVQQIITESF